MAGCARFAAIGGGLFALFIFFALIMGPAKVTPAEYQSGTHCLRSFDGSLPALRDQVRNALRDPDSFELVDTTITPLNADKLHTVTMTYRARNGFGGVNTATTRAIVGDDCAILKVIGD